MLRCGALARAALRGAPKHDVAQVTRTLSQLPILSQQPSFPAGALLSVRTLATRAPARTQKAKSSRGAASPKKRTATTPKKKPATRKTVKKKTKAKVPLKPKKKVLSEKAKLLLAKKKALAALKELKATALVEPKGKPDSAWTVYVSEKLQGKGGKVTEGIKAAAVDFKSLAASEREHYNHIANQNKEANQKAYAEWVSSHTPEQIRTANTARQAIKRKVAAEKAPKAAARSLSPIKDDRQVKRPQSAFFKFNIERRESGDYQGIALGDSSKLITKEWAELSAAQKKKYEDLQAADKERYIREYERVYGSPPPSASKS